MNYSAPILALFESFEKRANDTHAKGKDAFPVTFEEVDLLQNAGLLINGDLGGLVLTDREATPVIYHTTCGYLASTVPAYCFIANEACRNTLHSQGMFQAINEGTHSSRIRPYTLPKNIRTIMPRNGSLESERIILLTRMFGVIHGAAAKGILETLQELNEASIKEMDEAKFIEYLN